MERETWWWNEEVQESLRRKSMHSRNGRCRVETNELKEAYKHMKRKAKAAVANAKNEACKEWYKASGKIFLNKETWT